MKIYFAHIPTKNGAIEVRTEKNSYIVTFNGKETSFTDKDEAESFVTALQKANTNTECKPASKEEMLFNLEMKDHFTAEDWELYYKLTK